MTMMKIVILLIVLLIFQCYYVNISVAAASAADGTASTATTWGTTTEQQQQQTSPPPHPPPPPPPPPPPRQQQQQEENQIIKEDDEKTELDDNNYDLFTESGFRRWPEEDEDVYRSTTTTTSRNIQQQQPRFETKRTPIHYEFPIAKQQQQYDDEGDFFIKEGEETTTTTMKEQKHQSTTTATAKFASPRQDAVTRFMMKSSGHKLLLITSSACFGTGLGIFIGKSLLQSMTKSITIIFTILFTILAFVGRNPYSELVRALGLLLIWAIQQFYTIRKQYPAYKYLLPALGIAPRSNTIPFPPINNPWNWKNDNIDDDNDYDNNRRTRLYFHMTYTVLAMAIMGSIIGGNIPLIPTSIGAILGAVTFAYTTTLQDSSRGDLARCMGMRIVALGREITIMNNDLELLHKFSIVIGRIMDRLLFLDRKHRIKEKVISGVTIIYNSVTNNNSNNNTPQDDERYENDNDKRRRRMPPPDSRRRRPPPPSPSRPDGRQRQKYPDNDESSRRYRRSYPDEDRYRQNDIRGNDDSDNIIRDDRRRVPQQQRMDEKSSKPTNSWNFMFGRRKTNNDKNEDRDQRRKPVSYKNEEEFNNVKRFPSQRDEDYEFDDDSSSSINDFEKEQELQQQPFGQFPDGGDFF